MTLRHVNFDVSMRRRRASLSDSGLRCVLLQLFQSNTTFTHPILRLAKGGVISQDAKPSVKEGLVASSSPRRPNCLKV